MLQLNFIKENPILRKAMLGKRVFMMILMVLYATLCLGQFAGGDGSERDPWQIQTAEHLNNVREYIGPMHDDKHFIQIADIDLGVPPWNEDGGWQPIGGWVDMWLTYFHGSYDGNGYIIEGLTIDRATTHQALFGYIYEANLQNIGLKDVNIKANRSVAGLVGRDEGGSTIKNCFVSGQITGIYSVAGIAAYVTGSDPQSIISNNYSVASLTTTDTDEEHLAGGIISHRNWGVVINNYATGPLYTEVESQNVGAVIGKVSDHPGEISANYWNIDTTLQSRGYGSGLEDIPGNTVPEMMRQETFGGFDFTDVWRIDEGESFPYFQWEGEEAGEHNKPPLLPPLNLTAVIDNGNINLAWNAPNEEVGVPDGYNIYRDDDRINEELIVAVEYQDTGLDQWTIYSYYVIAVYGEEESIAGQKNNILLYPGFAGGEGTEDNPYLIATAEQLNGIRFFLDSHFRQIDHIDLGIPPWNEDEGWKPLGESSERFTGSYDGDYKIISNLTIDRISDNVGLFGYTDDENRIQNVSLRNVNVSGENNTGALIGRQQNGIVANCNSSGSVNGNNSVGGLIGRVNGALVSGCYSLGAVSGTGNSIGGFIGYYGGSNMIDCYSRASVTSNGSNIGGFIGYHFNNDVGRCYSTGEVNHVDPDETVGGFIGRYRRGEVTESYWDIQTSGQEESQGGEGLIGRQTQQMIYPYEDNTYTGWDFEETWLHDEDRNNNNGYPLFVYQMEHLIVLDTPQVDISFETIDDARHAIITWEAVEDAVYYRVYATEDPATENWGEPIAVVEETQYSEPVDDNRKRFYHVVAAAD